MSDEGDVVFSDDEPTSEKISAAGVFADDAKGWGYRVRFDRSASSWTPELQDTPVVQAIDGGLWSFGVKDIARFDGAHWIRFNHPNNPPI